MKNSSKHVGFLGPVVCNVYSRRSHDSRTFRVSWRQETESPLDQNHGLSSYFSCKWPVKKLCKVWWCTMITLKTTILRMMIEQWKLIWFNCSSHHRVVCKNIIYEDPRSCKSLCSLHGALFTWSIMVLFLCFFISSFLLAVSSTKVLDSIWHDISTRMERKSEGRCGVDSRDAEPL